jgi:hypothetical protein
MNFALTPALSHLMGKGELFTGLDTIEGFATSIVMIGDSCGCICDM